MVTENKKIDEALRAKGQVRKIQVDRVKCIGANSCVAMAPGVFQLDEENLAYIVDPNSETDDAVMLAAQSCPVLAVLLFDENGKQIFPEE